MRKKGRRGGDSGEEGKGGDEEEGKEEENGRGEGGGGGRRKKGKGEERQCRKGGMERENEVTYMHTYCAFDVDVMDWRCLPVIFSDLP